MQDRHLYEYAVIRVVPRVEREEFVNVGIVVFCKRQKFVKMLFEINDTKLKALHNDIDTEALTANLQSFQNIAHGTKNSGPIALLDPAERFRWLTAVRSSVIQTSRPHPGLCHSPEDTANQLFNELVK
jgi:Protein of unknown function (DUF3037)